MVSGEIYLAYFPYGDVPAWKLRPVLLLTPPIGPVPELLVAYITTVLPAAALPSDLILDPTNAEQVSLGHFTLGMAEFHLHHDDAAYEHMRQATISSPQNGFAWQWLSAIDALHGRTEQARMNLAEYQKRFPGHTVGRLKASEYSRHSAFWQERNRFYEGLKLAGLPE